MSSDIICNADHPYPHCNVQPGQQVIHEDAAETDYTSDTHREMLCPHCNVSWMEEK